MDLTLGIAILSDTCPVFMGYSNASPFLVLIALALRFIQVALCWKAWANVKMAAPKTPWIGRAMAERYQRRRLGFAGSSEVWIRLMRSGRMRMKYTTGYANSAAISLKIFALSFFSSGLLVLASERRMRTILMTIMM